MTKFPLFIKTAQNIKHPPIPLIMPLATYEEAVGYERIKVGYKQALRGQRKYTREAVKYDLFREKNNVDLWRELKSSKYTPGPYHFTVITEPKRRDLSIPKLRDKVVQLVIHEELQNMFRPVFINGSFACQYGRGPIRAAFKVQHDMRVARMKWGDDVAVIRDRRPEVLLFHRPRPAQENPCEAVQEAQEEAPRHVRGSPSVLPASLQSD